MQNIELRPYQKQFLQNLSIAISKHKRVVACSPTGSGKTKTFLQIVKQAHAKGKTILVLTESRSIFKQITAEQGGQEIKAGAKYMFGVLPNRIYIGMVQTLTRRPLLIQQFAEMGNQLLIVNDEAHMGTSTNLLAQLPDALLLGFTATPDYASAKHLPELYRDCVVCCQVSDLVNDGYLVPYRHFARVSADLDKLKIKNGEFTEASQLDAFGSTAVFEGLIDDLKNIDHKKAIIFCSSIEHCERVTLELSYAGFKVVQVHSGNEQSDYDLFQFESGEVNICVSCYSLNKGYDHPPIDLTALLFSTKSRPRYLQSIGRASRLSDGKSQHICLDYGGNYERFGLWDADVEWDKIWKEDKKRKKGEGEGVAPVKACPQCEMIIPARSMVCPGCGELFDAAPVPEAQEGELIEITENMQMLRGRMISSLSPEELAVYARLQNKKGFAARVARCREQENPGYLAAYAGSMGYKKEWISYQTSTEEQLTHFDFQIR